jgi:hypothetical protein
MMEEITKEARRLYGDNPEKDVEYYAFINGVIWGQKQTLDFLYLEITERRDYSASKMCEEVIKFIKKLIVICKK